MIRGKKIILRNKNLTDGRDDFAWRTDLELARLDAAPPPNITFKEYLAGYESELLYPPPIRHRFAIDTPEGKHIGNCTYYNINETRGDAELGIMIGNRDFWNQGYGTDAVNTLIEYFFRNTRLNRIYLKTLKTNVRAQRCFQKCGFTSCGKMERDGFNFILMELPRARWQARQEEQG